MDYFTELLEIHLLIQGLLCIVPGDRSCGLGPWSSAKQWLVDSHDHTVQEILAEIVFAI